MGARAKAPRPAIKGTVPSKLLDIPPLVAVCSVIKSVLSNLKSKPHSQKATTTEPAQITTKMRIIINPLPPPVPGPKIAKVKCSHLETVQ